MDVLTRRDRGQLMDSLTIGDRVEMRIARDRAGTIVAISQDGTGTAVGVVWDDGQEVYHHYLDLVGPQEV